MFKSLGMLLLQWFTLTLPFSLSEDEAADEATQIKLREKLMRGERPFENFAKVPP
jgi:hypothetical protein